jgi:predicted  nucleic acid-binding Zn-ribbon protein
MAQEKEDVQEISMSTTQLAAQLFQLQQLDLELDRLSAEMQAVATALQGNAELQKRRAEYEIAQQQLQTGLLAQKEAEWTLEDINNRLKAQEQRMFSGSVNNTKELQSLQNEAQRLRAQQSHQEETTLEVIDAAEALQEAAQRRLNALQKAEEAWQQESSTLVSRRDQFAVRQQELQSKRSLHAASIDQGVLARYEAMRRTRQGRAVSKVEQNACQWCRVILTPSELQHVRISAELQTCTNCGRILYYDR